MRFGGQVSLRKRCHDAARAEVGDVVPITHSTPGWSGKYFRILGIKLQSNDEVKITAREYDSSVYVNGISATDATPNTNLPDPFTVAPPTSLVWTFSDLYSGTLSWTAADDAFVDSYEVQYKLSGSSDWLDIPPALSAYAIFTDLQVGTWNFRVRSVSTLSLSDWVELVEVVPDGALLAPTSASLKVKFSETAVTGIQVQLTVPILPAVVVPTGLLLYYSIENQANSFTIGSVDGSKIYMQGAEVLSSGSVGIVGTVEANQAMITTTSNPMPTTWNPRGMWWAQVDSVASGLSQWQKVKNNTATYVEFKDDFSPAPVSGDTLNYREIAFKDNRPAGFKMLYVFDGTDYEIINHNGLETDGTGVFVTANTRGAEGSSTLSSLVGLTAHYFPGPEESEVVIIPSGEFYGIDSTTAEVDHSVVINLENIGSSPWAAFSCCAYKAGVGTEKLPVHARSSLIPLTFLGTY